MTFDAESLRKYIPYWLTAPPEQKAFAAELKALVEGAREGYFLSDYHRPVGDDLLQGDGWRGFQLFSFASGARMSVLGIVLSNSCDVSAENQRVLATRVTFASLIKLSRFEARLRNRGIKPDAIAARIEAIKSQSVTSVVYLPGEGPLNEDYLALLDDLHSMPVPPHRETADREHVFTLSRAGFYLFLVKLSMHFCRVQENLDRSPQVAAS